MTIQAAIENAIADYIATTTDAREVAQEIEDAVFSAPEFCPHFGEFGDVSEMALMVETLNVFEKLYDEGRVNSTFLVPFC